MSTKELEPVIKGILEQADAVRAIAEFGKLPPDKVLFVWELALKWQASQAAPGDGERAAEEYATGASRTWGHAPGPLHDAYLAGFQARAHLVELLREAAASLEYASVQVRYSFRNKSNRAHCDQVDALNNLRARIDAALKGEA